MELSPRLSEPAGRTDGSLRLSPAESVGRRSWEFSRLADVDCGVSPGERQIRAVNAARHLAGAGLRWGGAEGMMRVGAGREESDCGRGGRGEDRGREESEGRRPL